jgi:hypothetical protein
VNCLIESNCPCFVHAVALLCPCFLSLQGLRWLMGLTQHSQPGNSSLNPLSMSVPAVSLRCCLSLQGLRWLVGLTQRGLNGILADDMGLGKTLQVSWFGVVNVRIFSGNL